MLKFKVGRLKDLLSIIEVLKLLAYIKALWLYSLGVNSYVA